MVLRNFSQNIENLRRNLRKLRQKCFSMLTPDVKSKCSTEKPLIFPLFSINPEIEKKH